MNDDFIKNYDALMEYCRHNQEAFDRLRALAALCEQEKQKARADTISKVDVQRLISIREVFADAMVLFDKGYDKVKVQELFRDALRLFDKHIHEIEALAQGDSR